MAANSHHILVVDDDRRIRELIKSYLIENGFMVTVAGTAAEARERMRGMTFDLLVLDLGPTSAGDGSLFPENETPPADAAIVVRDLRYCTPSESQAIGERLSLSGIEAVGIAENFVPQEKLVA